jgi:hypothetical protein
MGSGMSGVRAHLESAEELLLLPRAPLVVVLVPFPSCCEEGRKKERRKL